MNKQFIRISQLTWQPDVVVESIIENAEKDQLCHFYEELGLGDLNIECATRALYDAVEDNKRNTLLPIVAKIREGGGSFEERLIRGCLMEHPKCMLLRVCRELDISHCDHESNGQTIVEAIMQKFHRRSKSEFCGRFEMEDRHSASIWK
jgi:hypothetical protein